MSKLIAALVLAAFVPFASAEKPVPQLPKVYIDTTFNQPTGTTWKAHTSTDFHSALNSAKPGDIIVLDAGVTYIGNFTLPVHTNPNQQWIYIETSALSSLPPPGTRVNPSTDLVNMATIVTPNMTSAITIPPGSSYYRLVGLEITSASTQGCDLNSIPIVNCYSYSLVDAASVIGQPLVDSITVDRSYLHGSPTQDVRRGVIANGSNIAVVDSYISDIHQGIYDSQAILAYYSPGPLKIVDNLLSATTEDVMFGGAGGKYNPWVPSDIEIRHNLFFKPLSWIAPGITLPPHPQWVVKNNLEFKSAQRVLVDGNMLENVWVGGDQQGYSVLFTVRTSQSGDIAVVDDITFTNNILQNVGAGFSTLYHDYECGTRFYRKCSKPGETRRIEVYNNLVLFRDPSLPGGVRNIGLEMAHLMTDFVLQHNTFVPVPGTDCWNAVYFSVARDTRWPPKESITDNVWILDNALCRQPTGDFGAQGTKGLTYYMGAPTPLGPRFQGNVMYVPSNNQVQQFPARNYSTTVAFTYTDPQNGDYQLLIPDWLETSDGQEAGINNALLQHHQQ